MKPNTYLMEICPNIHSNAIYAGNLILALSEIKTDKYYLVLPCSKDIEAAIGKKLFHKLKENERIKVLTLSNSFFTLRLMISILKIRPKLLHLQHEYAWYYNSTGIVPLLILAKFLRVPIIVTMHSVFIKPNRKLKGTTMVGIYMLLRDKLAKFYVSYINRTILFLSKSVIVHTEQMKAIIRNSPYSRNTISVIPHGSETDCSDHSICTRKNSPQTLCIKIIGYIEPRKGQDVAIEILRKLNETGVDSHLHIAGDIPISEKPSKKILDYFHGIVDSSKNFDNIFLEKKYLTIDHLKAEVLSADIILLPYKLKSEEGIISTNASGIFSISIGCGTIPVARNLPAFTSVLGLKFSELTFSNIEEAVSILSSFAKEPKKLNRISNDIRRLAIESISWESVARQHQNIIMNLSR